MHLFTLPSTVVLVKTSGIYCLVCVCVCVRVSSVKASHSPVVSKIDNRLEQYTTAVQVSALRVFHHFPQSSASYVIIHIN